MYTSKILITGGAGNIASALAANLAKKKDNFIVIVDCLLTGSKKKLPKGFDNVHFIKADVNDYNEISSIFYTYRFDYVFHFAAVVGVKRTLENPLMVLGDIKGIENILKLSKNTGVKRVYYSSSSEVYGEPVTLPQHEETTPLNSRLPYAIVKNLGEAYFKSFYQEFGLDYTVFRFFNTYGPNQSDDFVVPRFVKKALANEDITVHGDGSQTRTFIYIDDNIEICTMAHERNLFLNDVVNIGGGAEITILELAKTIIKVTGSRSRIVHLPPLKEGDMTRRVPDLSKIKAIKTNFVSLEEGIRRLINHFSNENR